MISNVSPHQSWQFQFDLDPQFIKSVSLSDPPSIEIIHQGVTGNNNTVAINNIPIGSLDPNSNTTNLYFDKDTIGFSPSGNTFAIASDQDTNFTITSITLSSGPIAERVLPEFPSLTIPFVIMIGTLIVASSRRRRRS